MSCLQNNDKIVVGILSMQRIANYGSFLQAYGLKKIMEDLGCEVQFVDYHPGSTILPSPDGTGLKRKLFKTVQALSGGAPLKEKIRYIKYKKNYSSRYDSYLEITDRRNYTPDVDVLIIGSDEVFNCVQSNTNVGFAPELFGAYSNSRKLVSYAASFGNTTLELLRKYNLDAQISEWLKKFDSISVRDSNSEHIISQLTGNTPESHLDPVLVYDYAGHCQGIPRDVPEHNYLIVYGYSNRFTDYECRCIRKYAEEKNLRILCIGGIQNVCDRFIDTDPFTVISYFQHADAVITDTFHGTILSVITHRPFVSVIRSAGYGNSEKLQDLLIKLQLENRILSDFSELTAGLEVLPDFTVTDNYIRSERLRAIEYLKSVIHVSPVHESISHKGEKVPCLYNEAADCCGCGACLAACPSHAIVMKKDPDGFLYPFIDEDKCIGCGKCQKVCGYKNYGLDHAPLQTFAASARDKDILMQSSSGGIFAVLADEVISRGGLVAGAVMMDDFSVEHILIHDKKELIRLQGSKYVQSRTEKIYQPIKEELLNGKQVLFSGTPCQVAGLYAYLGREFSNLLTVDIICHGVPNSQMFQDYISFLKKGRNFRDFSFRDKTIGWGINASLLCDGKKHIIWESRSPYLSYFAKGWLYRESCYHCRFSGSNRPADLTLGDFWGIEKCHPDYLKHHQLDTSKGISVVIANTPKGLERINAIKSGLICLPSTFENAAAGNAQLRHPCSPGKRQEILALYENGGWDSINRYFIKKSGIRKYKSQLSSLLPSFLKTWLKGFI